MLSFDDLPLSRKQAISIAQALTTPQLALWTGAVASGKTVASLIAFLICVTRAPRTGLIVMAGWTLQSIERNLIDPLMDEGVFGDLAAQVHHTTGSGTAEIMGRTVHLIGASDSRAEARIRGSTVALAYIDEVVLIPEAFFVMMLSRLRVPKAKLIATTNPANPGHWLRQDFILRAAEVGMRTWHFTLDDNPYLEPAFVARLKLQHAGLWYRRFILGQWIAAQGAVFDMFDRERHVVDVLPVMKRWIACAVDVGTVNPTAAVVVGLGIDRRLYAVAEWYWDSKARQRQLTDVQQSAKLREFFAATRHPGSQLYGIRPERLIIDPSAASFIRQVHNDKHLFAGGVSVMGADNAVIDGIRTVSSLVATGRLLVHSSCKNLIDQMESYSWDTKAAERGEDKPEKKNDHACLVAGTPVLTSAGWRPVESVQPGDLVMTRAGLRAVTAAGMTSPAAVTLRAELSGGQVLEATGNHPVWVAGYGWKRMDALRYGDILESWQSPRSSPISESVTGGIPTPRSGPSGCTTSPASETGRSAVSAGSMRRSGRTPTGRSRTAVTSTTATTTRSTTNRQTWSAWIAMSTSATTRRNSRRTRARRSTWPFLMPSAPWPQSGTAPRKGWPGTASTASARGRTAPAARRPASSAVRASARWPLRGRSGSAPTPASPSGVATPVSMTSSALVTGAVTASAPTSTAAPCTAPVHVASVAPSPGAPVPVWNLSVAECPEYFAAGVLVHNCDALRYGIFTTRSLWRSEIIPPEKPRPEQDYFDVAL